MVSSDVLRRWSKTNVALLIVVLLTARAKGAGSSISCVGDCNGDGAVTVDEIVFGVDIALQGFGDCPALNCNAGNLGVFVNCLTMAVNNAESDCPLQPTTVGACCLGECPGSECSLMTQRACCVYAETSEIALAISWCPPDEFDAATGYCTACTGACVGLPQTP